MTNERLIDLVTDIATEQIFIRGIIASLLCEIAMIHSDPKTKLDQLLASLQGVADGSAVLAEQNAMRGATQQFTKTANEIITMAEAMLVQRNGSD